MPTPCPTPPTTTTRQRAPCPTTRTTIRRRRLVREPARGLPMPYTGGGFEASPTAATTIRSPAANFAPGFISRSSSGARWKLLGQRLDHRRVAERLQLRPRHHVGGNVDEGAVGVVLRHLVGLDHRRVVGAQRLPGGGVDAAAVGQAARALEGGHRALQVGAAHAVDLAGREPGAVEQHLRAHHRRAARLRTERRRAAGGGVVVAGERRLGALAGGGHRGGRGGTRRRGVCRRQGGERGREQGGNEQGRASGHRSGRAAGRWRAAQLSRRRGVRPERFAEAPRPARASSPAPERSRTRCPAPRPSRVLRLHVSAAEPAAWRSGPLGVRLAGALPKPPAGGAAGRGGRVIESPLERRPPRP